MACYRHVDPLDFFDQICAAMQRRTTTKTPVVSLNTPPAVLQQMQQHQGQLPASVQWMDLTTTTEDPWWRDLVERTQVRTYVVPPEFDLDTDTPASFYWQSSPAAVFK